MRELSGLAGLRQITYIQAGIVLSILVFAAMLVIPNSGWQHLFRHTGHEFHVHAGARLRPLEPPRPGDRIVVFAPHPDDEALGVGGYIQRAIKVGAHVHVVLMTNGEYAESVINRLRELPTGCDREYEEYGTIRQQESLMALDYLGVPSTAVSFLSYPDHYLEDIWSPAHWLPQDAVYSIRLRSTVSPYPNALTPKAVFCGQAVLQDIEQVLLHDQPTIIITIQPNDIHPDHWATGAFVRFAVSELAVQKHAFAKSCRVYTYLIHRSWWPQPKAYRPDLAMNPPGSLLPFAHWYAFALTPSEEMRKGEAIKLYQTQGGATRPFMRSFVRKNELYATLTEKMWMATRNTKVMDAIVYSDFP